MKEKEADKENGSDIVTFPVMFGDGRTRPVTADFLVKNWRAIWDSFVGLVESLEEYRDMGKLNEKGREMLGKCYEFVETHPELEIEDKTTLNRWGDELGWPVWFKKITKTNL